MTWAVIGGEERDGLYVALNEATWIWIRVDAEARRAAVLLDGLSLPVEGPAPASAPVVVAVDRVSRIAASLQNGWWNDTAAEVVAVELEDLDATDRAPGPAGVGDAARRSRTVSEDHRAIHPADRRPQPAALRPRARRPQPLRRADRAGRGDLGAAQRRRGRGRTRPGQRLPARRLVVRAPVRPGDRITAEVEVLEVRTDKPISRPSTTVSNQHGAVVLHGTALVYTEPLG